MRFFLEAFRVQLKKTLRLPMIAVMLMFAAGILLLGQVFGENLAIQIGIVRPDTPSYARVEGRLASYGGNNWLVVPFETESALRRAVQSRRIEAGYVFGGGKISVYTSTATLTDRVSNLLVAAILLEPEMGEIGARVLAPLLPEAQPGILTANIQERAAGYLTDGLLMEKTVVRHVLGGNFDTSLEQGSIVPFLTTFAAVIIGLFCLPQYKPPHINRKTYGAAAFAVILVICGGFAGFTTLLHIEFFK